jgi:hypothetical protein
MNLEKQILECENRFWQAMIDKDIEGATKLTADPCIVTGAQGVASIDKKQFTKMMQTGSWELHDFEFSDVTFEQVNDDIAVIAYKVRENLTVDGKPLTLEAADASTWVRKGVNWVCALHTESVLGDPFGRDRKPLEGAKAA